MRLGKEQLRALWETLRATQPDEIDCEAFHARLAAFAEARARGGAPGEAFAAVEAHRRLCPSCGEECDALVAVLEEPLSGE
jgi:uncharacterized protein (UPF0212 family)